MLFGSTAFDTYKDTLAVAADSCSDVGLDNELTNTVALLVFCLIVGGTFTVAAMSTGVETDRPARPYAAATCPGCWPTR